jgi:hypothetical protein
MWSTILVLVCFATWTTESEDCGVRFTADHTLLICSHQQGSLQYYSIMEADIFSILCRSRSISDMKQAPIKFLQLMSLDDHQKRWDQWINPPSKDVPFNDVQPKNSDLLL